MSVAGGPDLIQNGLVLCLDAANTKSYPGSGTVWTDLSGNRYDGTLTNGPTFSSANGGSIVFDGTNDFVRTTNVDLTNTNKITLQFWCKLISYPSTVRVLMELCNAGSRYQLTTVGFILTYADDFFSGSPISANLNGNVGVNSSNFSSTLVNNLAWHNWCVIYDKSQTNPETSLYIDGIQSTSIGNLYTANNTNNFGSIPLHIGGRSGTLSAQVNIANVLLYNKRLTIDEILQNYDSTKSRFGL